MENELAEFYEKKKQDEAKKRLKIHKLLVTNAKDREVTTNQDLSEELENMEDDTLRLAGFFVKKI